MHMRYCQLEPEMVDLLQRHADGLLEIGWHDRRGQRGCVLGRTRLYAPWTLGVMTDEVNMVAD